MSQCVMCQTVIEDVAKTGRPKQYCSIACRRMAEREIRRIEKRIGELEEDLMRFRCLSPGTNLCDGRVEQVIDRHEEELKRQNDRFRLLLSGPESDDKD